MHVTLHRNLASFVLVCQHCCIIGRDTSWLVDVRLSTYLSLELLPLRYFTLSIRYPIVPIYLICIYLKIVLFYPTVPANDLPLECFPVWIQLSSIKYQVSSIKYQVSSTKYQVEGIIPTPELINLSISVLMCTPPCSMIRPLVQACRENKQPF